MIRKKDHYILTMDAGTTSVRALLINRKGEVLAVDNKEISQHYPKPGWHEQIAPEIWHAQLAVAQSVLSQSGIRADRIAAIGITNQRETTTIWSRRKGEPIYNSINWSDRRVAPIVDQMLQNGWEEEIRFKTGLTPDATCSAGKIIWLLDNIPGIRAGAEKGELAWGTIDTWLLWNLTGGTVHATDASNASRTMLMNLHTMQWDDDLLQKFRIPSRLLPSIWPTSHVYGATQDEFFEFPVKIGAVVGDQQAGLFGQTCFSPGMAKMTLGTSGVFDLHAGFQPLPIDGLVTNVGWTFGDAVEYTVEGVALMAGAVVQWLRDQLGLISNSGETESIAAEVADTGGVYLVPAHQGMNAPFWDMYARGALLGCSKATTKKHIVRAALEAIAYQTRDIIEAVHRSGRLRVSELRIDGGAARNKFLCQFLADILKMKIVKPAQIEATAIGTSYLAGLAVGFWENRNELKEHWKIESEFHPQMSEERREELYAGWQKAVSKCLGWLRT